MTYLAQPTRGHTTRSTQRTYVAAVDLVQDDIIRPELCNDAILARRPSIKDRQRRVWLNHPTMGEPERP